MSATLLLCSCEKTQTVDRDTISRITGLSCGRVHESLCDRELDVTAEALRNGETIIACGQQRSFFQDLAAELEVSAPLCVDIRDRAGWSKDAKNSAAKMAALIAEGLLPTPNTKTFDIQSDGVCLILGRDESALQVAKMLSQQLSVTVLLPEPVDLAPSDIVDFDLIIGEMRNASGSLGHFAVTIDGLRSPRPSGRGSMEYTSPKDKGSSQCDIILDLRGGAPLFSADAKRDGYLRADPRDQIAVSAAAISASNLMGTFEKSLYVTFAEELCAHERAGQSGCSRCLNVCPTGAILPGTDHISIDPNICAGCGSCAAVCPSGAVSFDDPADSFVHRRIQTLLDTYRDAGGKIPSLLIHDTEFGRPLLEYAARYGDGLPAHVLPLEVSNLAGIDHSLCLAALTYGAQSITILVGPKTERDALDIQLPLIRAFLSGLNLPEDVVTILDTQDPDILSKTLFEASLPPRPAPQPVLALGAHRDITRLAVKSLASAMPTAPVIALPDGAPYGAVIVNSDACTLCLSCVSLCPTGALIDNEDKPQLSFKEDACLQCGICRSACPESAITLDPRFDASDAALGSRILHEEEPYPCIECGKLFGVKSTIERIVTKLEGNHSMFTNSDNTRLIRMCDDCRVKAQFRSDQPLAEGDRPRVRTTDDYLKDRKPN